MVEVILRNILLQLDSVEVKGRSNIATMNNAMDNLEKVIRAIENAREQEQKEGAADANCDTERQGV